MTRGSRVGADEAFRELVHQFTDPLACLRELVQNSLDADSSRVDVRFSFEGGFDRAAPGLAVLEVEDNGGGMDERILDDYLLTLFSSTKEGDLTKIGKFGIGFVSIFALEPELVSLETGRRGESWRILFHPGGRFEKLSLERAVEGTRIRLLKRLTRAEFEELARRGAGVVRYWCKFAESDVRVDGASVREPFELAAPLAVRHQEEGTDLWLGFAPLEDESSREPMPFVGFYNRGLTLLESDRLPGAPPDLAGLSLRVKSRYLEHTLTRDDVRQDEHYDRLLQRVRELATELLRPRLAAHLEAQARWLSGLEGAQDPGPPGPQAAYLYAGLAAMDGGRAFLDRPVVPVMRGQPVSPRALRRLAAPHGCLLVASRPSPVVERLLEAGETVLRDPGGLSAWLARLVERPLHPAEQVLATAVPVPAAPRVEALLAQVGGLLAARGVRLERVWLGDLAYPGSAVARRIALRQQTAFGLTRCDAPGRPGLFGGPRQLVLHRGHPLVAASLRLAGEQPGLAALMLAEAVFLEEGGEAARVAELARDALALEARGDV
jgi:hypothetical protein